ncbi:MAG: helix-turn-helix domain-containing protein [Pyrinomonadaceae bacterium]
MGRAERIKQEKLAEKLKCIREFLELTYEQLIKRLDCPKVPLYRANIYRYESGEREPPLVVLLSYAKLIGVSTDILIDDKLNLPEHLINKSRK